ncbi:MAG: UDP-N-acetylmuramate dehydrogenase [Actinomycetota bacterium]
MMAADLAPDLATAAEVLGPLAERDRSLAPFCTYRVGGPAALFVQAESIDDLLTVRRAVVAAGCPTLVVGRGSNLLVADAGFPGIAITLGGGFTDIRIDGDDDAEAVRHRDSPVTVAVGAAALLPVVARKTAAAGLTGFEWAVGVPGSIGGAVRMNAGGHGSDMAASLHRVWLVDLAADDRTTGGGEETGTGRTVRMVEDLALGYRRSAIEPSQVVTAAELRLDRGDAETAGAEISEIVRWRREHQPGGQNAGSVFANPDGDSAGRIIDQLGLKGFRIGTAEVSTKHANFIQADPGGSADDVVALIREIRLRVAAATGIELMVENRLIGFDPGDL